MKAILYTSDMGRTTSHLIITMAKSISTVSVEIWLIFYQILSLTGQFITIIEQEKEKLTLTKSFQI